jgi:hypothetical protein
MKQGRIAILIILFYIADMIYELFFPVFPKIHKPWFFVFWRVYYYLIHYGILFFVAIHGFRKENFKPDKLALFTLIIYTAGKFLYYIFLINCDMPTYIAACNSKKVAIFVSIILWTFSIILWIKKFNINKLLKYNNYVRRH